MENAAVLLESKSLPMNLLSEMYQLRLLGHLCDVTVRVEHHGSKMEFSAHKSVLAASSKYFKEVFINSNILDCPNAYIHLNEIPSVDFASFLDFVYTARVEVEEDRVQRMIDVAEKLRCPELAETCFQLKKQMLESVWLDLQNISEVQEADEDIDTLQLNPLTGLQSPMAEPTQITDPTPLFTDSSVGQNMDQACVDTAFIATEENTEKKKEAMKKPQAKPKRSTGRVSGKKAVVEIPKKKYTRKLREQQNIAQTRPIENGNDGVQVPSNMQTADEQSEDSVKAEDDSHCEDSESYKNGDQDNNDQSANMVSCPVCGKSFADEKSFLKHSKQEHLDSEIVFRCDICSQTFANRCNLKSHQRHVHSNERRFPCELCGKKFKRKKDIKRHIIQVHEGGRERHFCKLCGKGLSSKTSLSLHERTHTGDKPFSCPHCQAKFSQTSALKTHLR